MLHAALVDAGFRCKPPQGAYYILADFSALSDLDDVAFSKWLARGGVPEGSDRGAGGEGNGVAPVPGSSFFHDPALGRTLVRFAFCKRIETLEEAGRRLRALKPALAGGQG